MHMQTQTYIHTEGRPAIHLTDQHPENFRFRNEFLNNNPILAEYLEDIVREETQESNGGNIEPSLDGQNRREIIGAEKQGQKSARRFTRENSASSRGKSAGKRGDLAAVDSEDDTCGIYNDDDDNDDDVRFINVDGEIVSLVGMCTYACMYIHVIHMYVYACT